MRRFGKPRTEEERKERHFKKFGTRKVPPRGTGLKRNRMYRGNNGKDIITNK